MSRSEAVKSNNVTGESSLGVSRSEAGESNNVIGESSHGVSEVKLESPTK